MPWKLETVFSLINTFVAGFRWYSHPAFRTQVWCAFLLAAIQDTDFEIAYKAVSVLLEKIPEYDYARLS